ncbi:UNVERIFIED_CONTAM: hypothetical protein Sangu_2542500 [Sesamum angustifolium]|uniref:Aminotransferase-like plant mobile domain-containing protein n=1 Tax=Sesamum angustifolium TaxID=2727405 RepID=A0AAW2JA49_9LAMI
MSLLVTKHQTTSPIYALWAVPSLKVMQSGMEIFILPENFAAPKDIGSGLRTCLADVEIGLKIYDAFCALLFTYDHNSDIIKAFCEAWCPLTNTLLTSAGEMCISLWDLHELVGLPMTGCLYDEVVPSALELTGVDEKRERFIPRSCKYLLYAYHLLQSADDNRCSHVSIDKWVKYWSKKTTKYHSSPPRKEKKTVWPKSTHNPLGDIAIHETWSTAEEALFAKLYIEGSLKEEVYLAAYLACWLCLFVLLGKDVNSIRPIWQELRGPKPITRLACLIRPKSIKITLKRKKDEDQQVNGGENDPPPARIPPVVIDCDSQAAVAEATNFVAELEDEVQSIDVGEESETSHSSTMTPPLGMGYRRKQSPPPAAMPAFKVRAYDEARSLSSEKLSRSLHEQQLKEVKARLQDVQAKASEEASEIQSAMDELEHVEEDIAVLKGRRTNLRATLKEKKQLNHDTQAKVH